MARKKVPSKANSLVDVVGCAACDEDHTGVLVKISEAFKEPIEYFLCPLTGQAVTVE